MEGRDLNVKVADECSCHWSVKVRTTSCFWKIHPIDWWKLTHVSEEHAVFMFRVIQEVCSGYPEGGGSKLLEKETLFQ